MFKKLKEILNSSQQETVGEFPKSRIPEHVIAASVLLLEIAYSDDHFSPEEKKILIGILKTTFNLGDDEADEVIREADAIRKEAVDIWSFTKQINAQFSRDEILTIMKQFWTLIYADGSLSTHEDYLIHRLANLLHVRHHELIAAKLAAKESLHL